MKNKPPVKEIRIGLVKGVIWANETEQGVRHNLTLSRLYKDGDRWKESPSFGRDDLPLLQLVIGRAFEWIYDGRLEAAPQELHEAVV